MAYSRSALALTLLLTACPGEDNQTPDAETGATSDPTSNPTSADEGPCPGGGSQCGNECVFLGSDEVNCGACGVVCGQGEECIGAVCLDLDPCDGGPGTACGPNCVDIDNDPNNCGDCGNNCEEGQSCNGGECMGPGETTGPPPGTGGTTNGDESSSGEPPGGSSSDGPADTGAMGSSTG